LFQCSSASRKFLNESRSASHAPPPKFQCSSASRKFLNQRLDKRALVPAIVSVLFSEPKIPQSQRRALVAFWKRKFQCSSASRKFLNRSAFARGLQKRKFQCSSASRKFLNFEKCMLASHAPERFSALQRAENSSMVRRTRCSYNDLQLFQCSSASRKFLNRFRSCGRAGRSTVSVLFSEPKIPQCVLDDRQVHAASRFSALQRAENSSIV